MKTKYQVGNIILVKSGKWVGFGNPIGVCLMEISEVNYLGGMHRAYLIDCKNESIVTDLIEDDSGFMVCPVDIIEIVDKV